MNNIRFISLQEAISIQVDQIKQYGGRMGIRDLNLLSSAIELPKATLDSNFLHETIFDMASAYLFHICQNHAFMDGNKRTALATCLIFLTLNGINTDKPKSNLYNLTIQVAKGNLTKKEISRNLFLAFS